MLRWYQISVKILKKTFCKFKYKIQVVALKFMQLSHYL